MGVVSMVSLSRRDALIGGGLLAANFAARAMAAERAPGTEGGSTTRGSFKPGDVWLDTAGKPIQAHGGSIIRVADQYYWYGENKEFTTGKTEIWTWGVRCYRSADLYNWEDLGLIIPPDPEDRNSPLHPAAGLDRPHILHNAATNKYVCWIKLLGAGHKQTRTVLSADAITGPYQIVHQGMQPLGMNAGDFDLCVSPDDGKAYMYFERVHTELICADLTDDYTNVTGYYSTHFPRANPPLVREGPAHFWRRGKHYLASSGTTGYFPNPSEIAVADTFHGPFTILGDLHPSDKSRTSFNSQISSVFKHPKKKDLYIALADRWLGPQTDPEFADGTISSQVQSAIASAFIIPHPKPDAADIAAIARVTGKVNTSLSRYVWLPIRFDGARPVIEWRDEWSLDEFD
jgi:Glycosyl hydrolases family 43